MNRILKLNPGMALLLRRTPEIVLRLMAVRSNRRDYSKNYDSSDDEKEPIKRKTKTPKSTEKTESEDKEESAAVKLNRLLASMKTDDPYSLAKSGPSNFSTPGSATRKRRETLKEENAKKDVFVAAKRVASMLGDEHQQKQTESELLSKLLGNTEEHTMEVDGTKKKSTPENDVSLSELIVGMKIDRNPQRQDNLSRGDYVRRTLAAARNQQQDRSADNRSSRPQKTRKREAETFSGSVNLWGAEPLGIFKNANELKESPDMLSTWSQLQHHDLQLQVSHPPSNYFEKVALWTEQGKVWRFPIDNEQDWQLEDPNTDFSEHIFLEQHLEPWCPTKGPIRHFMELVCVGLSKNPYISALEKKEHVFWYRDYFEQKREMLKEYMIKDETKLLNEKGTR